MIVEIVKVFIGIVMDGEGKCIGSNYVCVVEVGIGIGKIFVYLLGVMLVVVYLEKKVVLVMVMVVLQDQVIKKDIFDVLK